MGKYHIHNRSCIDHCLIVCRTQNNPQKCGFLFLFRPIMFDEKSRTNQANVFDKNLDRKKFDQKSFENFVKNFFNFDQKKFLFLWGMRGVLDV